VDGLARWNALPAADARRELLDCCHSSAWAREVAAGRPYPDVAAVVAAGAAALAGLPWPEVRTALDAHPRIGERLAARASAADSAGANERSTTWSQREQAGAADADEGTAAALVEVNRRYEERFGHVFLIFATGRTATQMLEAARARLGNAESVEREIIRAELGKITGLRLERLFTT
jgi:2-oxo-4-hydroxy-4-carboxy-5-ureidoimidazoline decarboxylase